MKRLITGIIAVSAWLLLLFLGPFPVFWLAITAVTAIGLSEYGSIALPGPDRHYRLVLILFGLLPMVGAYSGQPLLLLCGLTVALLATFVFALSRYSNLAAPFDFISRGGFGYLYISLGCAHLVLLMDLAQGRSWLLLLTAITAAADTAAFYTGKMLGKHKLCPAISPGKTVEGFLGGLIGSLIAAFTVRSFFLADFSLLWLAFIAIIMNCMGVAGDLSESVLKRAFGVKDSGTILPGHGGVLDRIDSLLLTAPLLYYMLYLYGIMQ